MERFILLISSTRPAHPSPRSLQHLTPPTAPCWPAPPLTALTPQRPLALYAPVLSALASSVPRWPDMNDTHYGEKGFTA